MNLLWKKTENCCEVLKEKKGSATAMWIKIMVKASNNAPGERTSKTYFHLFSYTLFFSVSFVEM